MCRPNITGREKDRRRGRAVVREAGKQVAEESQRECREQRRRAERQRDRKERRIHGTDVRRVAGEEIVAVKIREADSQKSHRQCTSPTPAPTTPANHFGTPSLPSSLAIMISAANHTNVFQASCSRATWSHSSTRVSSNTAIAPNAAAVLSMPSAPLKAHATTSAANVTSRIRSSRRSGPSAASFFRAAARACGVCRIAGG